VKTKRRVAACFCCLFGFVAVYLVVAAIHRSENYYLALATMP
jgi:hypothetical protein